MLDKAAGFEAVFHRLKAIFHRLKAILQPYESALVLKADTPANYSLDTPYAPNTARNSSLARYRSRRTTSAIT
jgi:hypothetical protein